MAEITYSRKKKSILTTDFREARAKLAREMCTEDCKYLELLINNRLLLFKTHSNDVCPIGIGEVLQRIIGKCVIDIVKENVQKTDGNLQMCAGQPTEEDTAMDAMRDLYNDKRL